MNIKKHIPNFITLLNLFAGLLSIYYSMVEELQFAGLMVFVAAIFDFFDGFAARLLNAKSAIGVQLDSLADMVSFGVAPAFIMFRTIELTAELNSSLPWEFLPFIAFLIPIFSALRLAKFNIDEEQQTHFIGMPTPAVAILVASLPIMILICLAENKGSYYEIITNPIVLSVIVIVSSFLMVSKLPMFALKFTSVNWAENQTRYIFIILSVFLIFLLKLAAIPLIILLYILISLFFFLFKNQKENAGN
jgi:CDP-diacylglycerol--serine O-phosphatidyltransferase